MQRLVERSVSNNTRVVVSKRNMHNGAVLLTDHQNLLDRILPPQGFRRPITTMESITGCYVELIGGETDLELELLDPNNDIVLRVTN